MLDHLEKQLIKYIKETEIKEKENHFPLCINTYNEEEKLEMIKVILSDKMTMGTKVEEFEKEFSKYLNVPYSVMVNSGSSANLLAIAALMNKKRTRTLKEGDNVLVPSVCWSTSVFPLIQYKLNPIFIDVKLETLNMNTDNIEDIIVKNNIKGIFAVHILGNSTNMKKLMEVVTRYNLALIEDTCESLGSKVDNKYLGTFGDFGTYSFYYSHHITTVEGGMVVCHNLEDYNLLRCLRAHGWSRHLTNKEEVETKYNDIDNRFLFINLGYNFRPMDMQGAMGLVQIKKLDDKNNNRINNFNKIKNELVKRGGNDVFIIPKKTSEDSIIAWFSVPLIIKQEHQKKYKELLNYLTSVNIENRPIVTGNFTRQPVCIDYNISSNTNLINADYIHNGGFFIGNPCRELSDKEIDYIVTSLLHIFRL